MILILHIKELIGTAFTGLSEVGSRQFTEGQVEAAKQASTVVVTDGSGVKFIKGTTVSGCNWSGHIVSMESFVAEVKSGSLS